MAGKQGDGVTGAEACLMESEGSGGCESSPLFWVGAPHLLLSLGPMKASGGWASGLLGQVGSLKLEETELALEDGASGQVALHWSPHQGQGLVLYLGSSRQGGKLTPREWGRFSSGLSHSLPSFSIAWSSSRSVDLLAFHMKAM